MRDVKKRRSALTWSIIITLSIILFALAYVWASHIRGYAAIGGEFIVLILPSACYAFGRSIRDIIRDFKRLYDEAPRE